MSIPTPRRFHPLLPGLGFGLLAVMAALYVWARPLYGLVLSYWTFLPLPDPFYDSSGIQTWIRCFGEDGTGLYSPTLIPGCGTRMNYPPLWMRLGFIPTSPASFVPYGLALDSLFLLSLGFLPLPARAADRLVMAAAAFSCVTVFGMERGNADLIIFMLILAAGLCLAGSIGARTIGYGAILVASVLKFYPLALFMLALRERPRTFAIIGVLALAGFAAPIVLLLAEYRHMGGAPGPGEFYNRWGAYNLPMGLPEVAQAVGHAFGLAAPVIARPDDAPLGDFMLPRLLMSAVLIATVFAARALVLAPALGAALRALGPRTYWVLLAGSVAVVSCFFAGPNIAYRGVFLLAVLPGLIALRDAAAAPWLRRLFVLTIACLLCVVWSLTLRHIAADLFGGGYHPVFGSVPVYLVWLVQELGWWTMITVLLAIVIQFVRDSTCWRALAALLPSRAAAG